MDQANQDTGDQKHAGAFMVADVALPKTVNGRELLEESGRLRAAHPIALVESCATPNELDFLWRFFEAGDFAEGQCRVYDEDGEPLGRYADFAEKMDAQTYIRFETSAYQWVKRFALGREWSVIAVMFERMMRGKAEQTMIDWGSYLTDADDERISYGGAVISMRMLALRLKDAYRDFARWYQAVAKADAETKGAKVSPREILRDMERDDMYRAWINEFKQDRGLPG